MNEKARKMARRAELERTLLAAHERFSYSIDTFADFLEYRANSDFWDYHKEHAKELIALYEGEM